MKKAKVVLVFAAVLTALAAVCILSVAFGSKSIDMKTIRDAFFQSGETSFEIHVIRSRIPRTLFGVLAGAGLAVSGCLMQSITRNPIADPGILGVNTGASLFVAAGISFFSISSANQFIWLAFLGAALTAVFVYSIASTGQSGATPMKLALAGAAVSTALSSLVNTIMLPSSSVMDSFRFWQTGSIGAAGWDSIFTMLPYLAVGFILSFCLAKHLNTLALGDELAAGLGINTKKIRGLAAFAGVLLCASTTALAGPIGFVGLMIPHSMRMLLGGDMRLLLPASALSGGVLLLGADVIGRTAVRPSELEVGIVTAVLGAPVFIYIVRKAKVRSL